jgi:hypothetical protein
MNFMLVCLAGDVFIGSIDKTSHKKAKNYIVEEQKSYIKVIGPNNVTQICSDFASAKLEALDELVAMYPHLYSKVVMITFFIFS